MNCLECHERLYAFLDRELTEAELAEVSAHLGECAGCEDSATFERRFLEHLRDSATAGRAPLELRRRILLRLSDVERPPS